MKKLFAILLFIVPFRLFAQNEVQPEGSKLLWAIGVLIALAIIYYLLVHRFIKKNESQKKSGTFFNRKLKVELEKDRDYKPRVLTLRVINRSRHDVDLEAPLLVFRKLRSIRKFKLKGMNRYQIYPLYLEGGKNHELRIDLSVFYNHDKRLRKYYWAEVKVQDARGKKYSSGYVTLRKSLFS